MTEPLEYRRINCGLAWESNLDFQLTNEGMKVNQNFLERLKDYNDHFNLKLLNKISNAIGKDGWAIYFSQASPAEPFFYASIFLDNPDYYELVHNICVANIDKEITVEYLYKGNLATYLAPYHKPQ